jgi:hypothetical protein
LRRGQFPVTFVSRHPLVKQSLRRQRDHQIIRTPDERHSDAIRVFLRHAGGSIQTLAVETGQQRTRFPVHQIVQAEMPDVHERVILIVFRLFPAHP